MAASEADSQLERASEKAPAERISLADFLKPRPSSRAPAPPAAAPAEVQPQEVQQDETPQEQSSRDPQLAAFLSQPPVLRRHSTPLPPPPAPEVPAPSEPERETVLEGAVDEVSPDVVSDDEEMDLFVGAEPQEGDRLEIADDGEQPHEDVEDGPAARNSRVGRFALAGATVIGLAIVVSVWLSGSARRWDAGSIQPAEATVQASPSENPPPSPATGDPGDLSDDADAVSLRREARSLLEFGRVEEGVAVARRAVEKDPSDAQGYILLAAGLQDQGKWDEAQQIFGKCVQASSKAERSECIYFARRGK